MDSDILAPSNHIAAGNGETILLYEATLPLPPNELFAGTFLRIEICPAEMTAFSLSLNCAMLRPGGPHYGFEGVALRVSSLVRVRRVAAFIMLAAALSFAVNLVLTGMLAAAPVEAPSAAPTQSAHVHGSVHVHADGTAHIHPQGIPAGGKAPVAPAKDHACGCGCGAACCMLCLPVTVALASVVLGRGSPLALDPIRTHPGADPGGLRRPPRPPGMN
jgi:hypothetical protein